MGMYCAKHHHTLPVTNIIITVSLPFLNCIHSTGCIFVSYSTGKYSTSSVTHNILAERYIIYGGHYMMYPRTEKIVHACERLILLNKNSSFAIGLHSTCILETVLLSVMWKYPTGTVLCREATQWMVEKYWVAGSALNKSKVGELFFFRWCMVYIKEKC